MQGQTNKKLRTARIPQRLRHSMTDAERALWRALRHGLLQGWQFRRQHPFGKYVLDFVCLEARLIIEVDGGQHAERMQADAIRTRYLTRAGFRVIRFWNHEVLGQSEAVLTQIWMALQEQRKDAIDG